jgi:Ner family transcriptional regulator
MHRARTADKAAKLRLEEINRIKAKLNTAGFTLLSIDRDYALPRGTAGNTLQQANLAGERAIAAALKTRPHLLWRSRYHPNGERRTPQPPENYQRPPNMEKRRLESSSTREAA